MLKDEIPENTVLSHDLLEGSYLRCGLASDILLMDGYPTSYTAFKTRLSRWTRGDWQIIGWLFSKIKKQEKGIQENGLKKESSKKKNPLNAVSKYKILNNLVKSIFEPIAFFGLLFFAILDAFLAVAIWPFIVLELIAIFIPSLIEIANRIIYRKNGEKRERTFYQSISGVKASIIRGILELGTLPDKASTMVKAICKTIYRMAISKKHL